MADCGIKHSARARLVRHDFELAAVSGGEVLPVALSNLVFPCIRQRPAAAGRDIRLVVRGGEVPVVASVVVGVRR